MIQSRPFKDRPWLIMEESSFWESLFFGSRTRIYVDEKHPDWIKIILETNKKLKNIKVTK